MTALVSAGLVCLPVSFVAADDIAHSDKTFLKDAYQGGLAEVQLGEMGKSKGTNSELKTLADKMITEHQKCNAELKTLADSKKVELATEPSLMAKGKLKLLDRKANAEFDKSWANQAASDHKSAIKDFENAARDAKDGDVKAFAERTLPTLRMHLTMAESVQRAVGAVDTKTESK